MGKERDETPRDNLPLKRNGRAEHRSRRLLVAEDNPVNQMVIRHQLRLLGHRVDVVSNGHQALKALGQGRYDLVLMDCQMPVLDGYEATRRIRLAGKGLPVIAFTSQTLSKVHEKCRNAGMNDFLVKPSPMRQLRKLLDTWLQ